MSKLDIPIGTKFGRLTVVRQLKERKRRSVQYECKCDCGNVTAVIASHLKSGNTKSCGCYFKEKSRKTLRELSTSEEFEKKRIQGLNRFDVVEKNRKNGIKRREEFYENIGLIEHTSISKATSKKPYNTNKTGVRGVYKVGNKYVAVMKFKKTRFYHGRFESLDEAAEARKEAEARISCEIDRLKYLLGESSDGS